MITVGPVLSIAELAERRLWADDPDQPLLVVDLDSAPDAATAAAAVAERLAGRTAVLVGVTDRGLRSEVDPLVDQLDVVLGQDDDRRVAQGDVASIEGAVGLCPIAAVCLAGLLRLTAVLPAALGLQAESFAYSTLQAGPEHARWLAVRPPRRPSGGRVRVRRTGARLDITLADPDRRNAYSRQMRDELVDALRLLDADDSITEAHLRAEGPAFCSGGDLDEFGTTPDPATGHLVRSARSAALLLHEHRSRVHVHVHGACVGAGVELAAFANRISARGDSVFRLPELTMGLVPGAGGTVAIAHRIGRWRTAYMALTGTLIDVSTALAWGLVDAVEI